MVDSKNDLFYYWNQAGEEIVTPTKARLTSKTERPLKQPPRRPQGFASNDKGFSYKTSMI